MISFRTWKKEKPFLLDYVKLNTFALQKAAETINKTKTNIFYYIKSSLKGGIKDTPPQRKIENAQKTWAILSKIKANGPKHVKACSTYLKEKCKLTPPILTIYCWWDCGETDILYILINCYWKIQNDTIPKRNFAISDKITQTFTSPTSKNPSRRYNSTNTKQNIQNIFTVALFVTAKDWKQSELLQKRLIE